jgi:hypothetical protein
MQGVLKAIKDDPTQAQHYLQDPTIAANINKLIAAGILRTK